MLNHCNASHTRLHIFRRECQSKVENKVASNRDIVIATEYIYVRKYCVLIYKHTHTLTHTCVCAFATSHDLRSLTLINEVKRNYMPYTKKMMHSSLSYSIVTMSLDIAIRQSIFFEIINVIT